MYVVNIQMVSKGTERDVKASPQMQLLLHFSQFLPEKKCFWHYLHLSGSLLLYCLIKGLHFLQPFFFFGVVIFSVLLYFQSSFPSAHTNLLIHFNVYKISLYRCIVTYFTFALFLDILVIARYLGGGVVLSYQSCCSLPFCKYFRIKILLIYLQVKFLIGSLLGQRVKAF